MAFENAHSFTIQNFTAVDRHDGGNSAFSRLEQEACLGAGHQSKERFDAPKCHPETRKTVIADIMSWVNSKKSKEPIMWMSGPAGAGKSAISQTVCERCHEENKLLAAFFFSRTAIGTGRDDGNRLVPTIACQLAIEVPEAKSFIIDALEKNTSLPSYSMEVQMKKLILEPLSQVYDTKGQVKPMNDFNNVTDDQPNEVAIELPHLVVIDALDECKSSQIQSNIIRMISDIFSKAEYRLRFLIVSRPELEIRNTFQTSSISQLCARIVLNEDYKPYDYIRIYLQSGFASLKREHTLASSLTEESNWPSSDDIWRLVKRSSGQFIYASTIMNYLKHPRRDPREVLQSVLKIRANTEDGDALLKEALFAELDALYKQVLSSAASNLQGQRDSVISILQVLLFQFPSAFRLPVGARMSISMMASFLSMKETKLQLLLSDLHSIIYEYHGLRFYHASFQDFLKDPSRSGEFYINQKMAHTAIAHHCFTKLSQYQSQIKIEMSEGEEYSLYHYFSHIEESGFNDALLKELGARSIMRKILDLMMHMLERSRPRLNKFSSHFGEAIRVFFKFDFNEVHFATPKNEEIKDVCDLMSEIIDELILSSFSTVYDTGDLLIDAILEIIYARNSSHHGWGDPYKCWVCTLLEIPERGKHLYLDSERSMRLYTKFCSNQGEFENKSHVISMAHRPPFGRSSQIKVLEYILNRIEPSADINCDGFREMSEGHSTEFYLRRDWESEEIEPKFLEDVDKFLQKCVEMKTANLKQEAVEDHTPSLNQDPDNERFNNLERERTAVQKQFVDLELATGQEHAHSLRVNQSLDMIEEQSDNPEQMAVSAEQPTESKKRKKSDTVIGVVKRQKLNTDSNISTPPSTDKDTGEGSEGGARRSRRKRTQTSFGTRLVASTGQQSSANRRHNAEVPEPKIPAKNPRGKKHT